MSDMMDMTMIHKHYEVQKPIRIKNHVLESRPTTKETSGTVDIHASNELHFASIKSLAPLLYASNGLAGVLAGAKSSAPVPSSSLN